MWAFENPAFACLEIDYEVENRDIQALYEPRGRQSDLARDSGFETYFSACALSFNKTHRQSVLR